MSMLAFGCGTTLSELEDAANSVSVDLTCRRLAVQGMTTFSFPAPESAVTRDLILATLLATIAAVHAALYLPFKRPVKTMIEIVYKMALKFNIKLSPAAKKVVAVLSDAAGAAP